MWKSVSEYVDLDPGLGKMWCSGPNLGREPSRRTKALVSFALETAGPNSIAVAPHRRLELDPRLWLPGKLSVPNGAGEARAPSVIQALDRRARVIRAGMNP